MWCFKTAHFMVYPDAHARRCMPANARRRYRRFTMHYDNIVVVWHQQIYRYPSFFYAVQVY